MFSSLDARFLGCTETKYYEGEHVAEYTGHLMKAGENGEREGAKVSIYLLRPYPM